MEIELIKSDWDMTGIANIASICYGKEEAKDPAKLIKHLYNNGHHSVFEHCSFTWKIDGISRAASHQFVRHRMASYTQRSQRYTDESDCLFVIPDSIAENKEALKLYSGMLELNKSTYDKLLEMGIKKEDARYVLPNACGTSIIFTCNLREFMHICNERLCLRAQEEIRMMIKGMVSILPEEVQEMCKPKCESGFMKCNNPCDKKRR